MASTKRNIKLLETFGDRVRSARNSKGFSQEKLAELADLDRTYISGVERGIRNISLVNIASIAKALNAPLAELMKDL